MQPDVEIINLYDILVQIGENEGLVFASTEYSEDELPKQMPIITHTEADLDGMLELAKRIALDTSKKLVLHKYSTHACTYCTGTTGGPKSAEPAIRPPL